MTGWKMVITTSKKFRGFYNMIDFYPKTSNHGNLYKKMINRWTRHAAKNQMFNILANEIQELM